MKIKRLFLKGMPIFCLSILLLASPLFTNGQKIVTILMADTSDKTIGEGCTINFNRMKRLMTEISEELAVDIDFVLMKGEQCHADTLQRYIRQIQVSKDDVILFHFSGHGTNRRQAHRWPRMLIDKKKGTTDLLKIHQLLKAKTPRLLLNLSDCCNGRYIPKHKKKGSAKFSFQEGDKAILKDLFLKKRGDYIATASRVGSSAYYDKTFGGYFTMAFCESFYYLKKEKSNPSWRNIFGFVHEQTGILAGNWNIQQQTAWTYAPIEKENNKKVYHTIQKGETLLKIAKKYGTSVKRIIQWNKLNDPNLIRKGKRIRVK